MDLSGKPQAKACAITRSYSHVFLCGFVRKYAFEEEATTLETEKQNKSALSNVTQEMQKKCVDWAILKSI